MTAPTVAALVARLRKLKVWDDHPSNASLGDLAATALQAESAARIAAERERDSICEKAVEKTIALDEAEARADREKARADEAERGHLLAHDRAAERDQECLRLEAALTACRQDTAKLIAELELKARGADAVIAAIERAIPDWRSYRDLVDAVECKLAEAK